MRVNIIFHSESGNLYLIAESFKEQLKDAGLDARLYRIDDPDLHVHAAERNDVNEYYEEIMDLPVASNEKLMSADVIMLGVPSRFGMPSAETKAFLDHTWPFYLSKRLVGKYFYPFATSYVSYKDALDAIESVENWASLMGLESIDYPAFTHKDGEMMPQRPGEELERTARELSSIIKSQTKRKSEESE